MRSTRFATLALAAAVCLLQASFDLGQAAAQPGGGPGGPGGGAARRGGGPTSDGGGGMGGGDLASPVVDENRMVTFRLRAPDAKTVVLTCDFQDETPLTKDENGVWSVTVGPVDPDLYYYNFVIDGYRTIDTGNALAKVGYYTSTLTSILEVPSEEPAFYDVQDVPHGEIRTLTYKSKSNDVVRELNVYVPPGYDENPDKRYPVLYLLHGNANDQHSWQRYGRANEILDNLIAKGEIEPFLVVMPLGYARARVTGDSHGRAANSGSDNRGVGGFGGGGPRAGGPGGGGPGAGAPGALGPVAGGPRAGGPGAGGPAAGGARRGGGGFGGGGGGPDLYERDILEDVIPMIDAKYRTVADRRGRAIFGFSMGGGQSGRIGLGNLDTFSYVGIMSAGAGGADRGVVADLVADVDKANEQLDLLWIGCGTADFAYSGAKATANALKEAGVEHTFVETPDAGHHWRVWRHYLHDVAPQLFAHDSE